MNERNVTPLNVLSRSPEETRTIGAVLGTAARTGDVIALTGGLGSGKTCLTQGILRGLGGDDYARSPTFLLVAQHRGRLPLYHVDLYRLDTSAEIDALGLEEYLYGDGLCVLEWADKAPGLEPENRLTIHIERVGETTRRLAMAGEGERPSELIRAVGDARGEGFQSCIA